MRRKRIKRIDSTRRYWDICKDLNRETMANKQKLKTFFLTFFYGDYLRETKTEMSWGTKWKSRGKL